MDDNQQNDEVVNKRYSHRNVDSPDEGVERVHPTSIHGKRDGSK